MSYSRCVMCISHTDMLLSNGVNQGSNINTADPDQKLITHIFLSFYKILFTRMRQPCTSVVQS